MKVRKKISNACLYFILCSMLIVWFFPFFWIIRTSLMEFTQIISWPPVWIPDPIIFTNFTEGLTILPFTLFFRNTVFIIVMCLIGTLFTCTLCAYSFSRLRWPGRNKVFGLILTAMMLPPAVTLIPTFIGWSVVGGVNTHLPLIVPAWLGGGAFFIFLARQFFLTIPRELDEAALVDGAGYFTIYLRILLPTIRPVLIAIGLFVFINNWNDFLVPLVYLHDERLFTVALGLRTFMGMYHSQWGYMMAAATFAVIPVLIIFLFGQKYVVEGVVMTGIKG